TRIARRGIAAARLSRRCWPARSGDSRPLLRKWRRRRRGETEEETAAQRGLARRDEDDDLTLAADAERIDRMGQARAKKGRDPLALEEALEDERLRLIAAAYLDQAALAARLPREPRKRDHLPAHRHEREYNPCPWGRARPRREPGERRRRRLLPVRRGLRAAAGIRGPPPRVSSVPPAPARGPCRERAPPADTRSRSRLRPRRLPAARACLHDHVEVRGLGGGRHAGSLRGAPDVPDPHARGLPARGHRDPDH